LGQTANINFQEIFSLVKLLKMKTIVLFGFLLSMTVLLTEAGPPTGHKCTEVENVLKEIVEKAKNQGLSGGLGGLGGLLSGVLGLLSNLLGIVLDTLTTVLNQPECEAIQGEIDLLRNGLVSNLLLPIIREIINPYIKGYQHCQLILL
ncbi:hypothetical protein Anas_09197, partial [Armadillidium nasatum]